MGKSRVKPGRQIPGDGGGEGVRVGMGPGWRRSEEARLPSRLRPRWGQAGVRARWVSLVPGASAALRAQQLQLRPVRPLTRSCDSRQVAQPPCRPVSSSAKGDVSNSTGCLPSTLCPDRESCEGSGPH